jgi:hypothetical protein
MCEFAPKAESQQMLRHSCVCDQSCVGLGLNEKNPKSVVDYSRSVGTAVAG